MPRKKEDPYPGIPKFRLTPKGRRYHKLLEANFLEDQSPYFKKGIWPTDEAKKYPNYSPELEEEERLWQERDQEEMDNPEKREIIVQKATLRNILRLADYRWLPILQTYEGWSPSGEGIQTEMVEQLVDDGMIVPIKSSRSKESFEKEFGDHF